jgi:hypothetical protein
MLTTSDLAAGFPFRLCADQAPGSIPFQHNRVAEGRLGGCQRKGTEPCIKIAFDIKRRYVKNI